MNTWDDVAAGYDDVAQSSLGLVLRARVHDLIAPKISAGTTVVDIGCGTGIDAVWLADRGATVIAVDGSAEMVRIASSKLTEPSTVFVHDIDRDDLACRVPDGADLILANFGVVNCVQEPTRFAGQIAAALRPGAIAVMVTMTRFCPAEIIASVARGDMARARRRMAAGPVVAEPPLDLTVQYYSARQLDAAFGDELRLRQSWSIGTVLPTFAQRRYLENRPRLLSALDTVDRLVARSSSRMGMGDHQLAVFECTP